MAGINDSEYYRLSASELNEVKPFTSSKVDTATASTQCGSANLKEDSNIVTVKSWSDDEEEDPTDASKVAEESSPKNEENKSSSEVTKDPDEDGSSGPEGKRKATYAEERTVKKLKCDVDQAASDNHVAKISLRSEKKARYESTEERFAETSYYFENGLRKVYPYEYTFKSFTKGRWIGQKILDVFSREFRAQNAEEYDRCLKAGSLTVNGQKVESDYILKHNDVIENVVHRHEVPVTGDPIEIIHLDKDVVVINKPASIPVHPCGRYRHNTIVFILAKEYNLKNLRTVHRLDRLTSGVLIFCRTGARAKELEYQIRTRIVSKEYVCLVEGKFPDGEIECNEPIEVVSYKIGVCRVSPKGKSCSTTLKRLSYNDKDNTSVVLCQPHTGRMHQIRVHLQYLGYPIIRDPLYNHPVFGPEKGKNGNIGKSNQELIEELIHLHNAENWLGDGAVDVVVEPESLGHKEAPEKIATTLGKSSVPERARVDVSCQTNYTEPDPCFNPSKMTRNENCSECKHKYRDPKPSDMRMYLHAFSYKGPGWSYQTKLPVWAEPDWVEVF